VPQKPAEQLVVIVKENPKQGRATAESDFSYLWSSYLLEYIMVMNHTHFEEDRVFGFQVNALHFKQVITECMISTFKHRQLLSSKQILCTTCSTFPVGCGFNYTPL